MCRLSPDFRFSALGSPAAVWTISSVHADHARLAALHDALEGRIQPGDRVVYFGNYTGHNAGGIETIDELLAFRRRVLARPGMKADDIVYLRGAQEDMWARLLQLQFHTQPLELFLWMLTNGLAHTLQAYGIDPHDGLAAAREGVVSLTRWTGAIRQFMRRHPGHDMFTGQLRRAAYTALPGGRFPLLFGNAGVDPARPLESQDDALCWGGEHFSQMQTPFAPFEKVVRGYDAARGGVYVNCVTASLDGGCGFGGPLVGAGMSADGEIFELLEA